MQKLKRIPLLQRLESTLKSLPRLGSKLLLRLPRLPDPLTTVVLIASCLLLLALCSGCVTKTVRTPLPPLPSQADPRPLPRFTGSTYRDSILWSIEVRESFMSCEADKSVLRKVYGRE